MYNNIGGKIKGLAVFVGIGGAIIFLILGFIFIGVASNASRMEEATYWSYCITFFIMVPVSIIASYPLYGFGELVEKVSKVVDSKQFDPEQQGKVYYKDGRSTFADPAAAPVVSNDLPEL